MKLLDCTLRDGGYYTSWDFDDSLVDLYLKCASELPVDAIELGYRSRPLDGYFGKYFYCPRFVLEKARVLLGPNKKLAVMVNEKDCDPGILRNLVNKCADLVDIVRFAVDPQRIDRLSPMLEVLHSLEIESAVNLMYASRYRDRVEQLVAVAENVKNATYLNLVDSYGGLFPNDLRCMISALRQTCKMQLGFHGHNNLELAFANALAAYESGCDWLDCTVAGMGRGAGNLKTELILTRMAADAPESVNMDRLSELVAEFESLRENYKWGTNLPYMVSGVSSLPQKDVMDWVTKRYVSINTMIRALENAKAGREDNLKLPYLPHFEANEALLLGGGPSACREAVAITSWLNAKGSIPVIHSSSRNAPFYVDVATRQYYCLVGNEANRLERLVPPKLRTDAFCVLPPYPRRMGTVVPHGLIGQAFELPKITFTPRHHDSCTTLAIEICVQMGVKTIWVAGYDGYHGSQMGQREHELLIENEKIFHVAKAAGITLRSLTPTRYENLGQDSVYSYLD